jgi:hypothetical protein
MFTLCGALMMFSYANMAMLFLGIETLSISLYVMAGSRRFEVKSNEAGFKYFLMGSFASAFLLFGIALIFGVTGTFSIDGIGAYMRMHADSLDPKFIVGMLLMVFAMLFKVSAAPFHFWSPDVYEGAPTLITALMSTLVKIAAFAAFYKLVSVCFVFAMGKAELILTFSCAATLLIGNLVALVQDNFKAQIFDITRVTVDQDGLLLSKQCTGRRYLDMIQRSQTEPLRYTDKASQLRITNLANKLIGEFYEFFGYLTFANLITTKKLNSTPNEVEKWINDTFDVIILRDITRDTAETDKREEFKKQYANTDTEDSCSSKCIYGWEFSNKHS